MDIAYENDLNSLWYIIQSVHKLPEWLQAKYKQYCDNVHQYVIFLNKY